MVILDVNVLIHTHRAETKDHAAIAASVGALMNGPQAFGVPEMVFQSVVRVVTQSAFTPPSTTVEALEFCNRMRSSPRCAVLHPGERHWAIFESVCRQTGARGNLVADAYLAAFALERGDEWVTLDGDYAKFPGLRWRGPLDKRVRVNPGTV